jgi:hypothetical protein
VQGGKIRIDNSPRPPKRTPLSRLSDQQVPASQRHVVLLVVPGRQDVDGTRKHLVHGKCPVHTRVIYLEVSWQRPISRDGRRSPRRVFSERQAGSTRVGELVRMCAVRARNVSTAQKQDVLHGLPERQAPAVSRRQVVQLQALALRSWPLRTDQQHGGRHLLEVSARDVPAVARTMGMPEVPAGEIPGLAGAEEMPQKFQEVVLGIRCADTEPDQASNPKAHSEVSDSFPNARPDAPSIWLRARALRQMRRPREADCQLHGVRHSSVLEVPSRKIPAPQKPVALQRVPDRQVLHIHGRG